MLGMHDSTANAFRTTVPCLSGRYVRCALYILIFNTLQLVHSTHKIIGISTLSRCDHSTTQTRELACTKVVIPQVCDRGEFFSAPQWHLVTFRTLLFVGTNLVKLAICPIFAKKCTREYSTFLNKYLKFAKMSTRYFRNPLKFVPANDYTHVAL